MNKLRSGQDKLLIIVDSIIHTELGDHYVTSRDFRVKFPDDVLQEGLRGQLWFGAEVCMLHFIVLYNNNIYLKSNIQCIYAYEFSGLYTIRLYNLKQYDHNQILNELVILHYCIL